MPEEWLVDGYNLLHRLKAAVQKKSDLSLARLIERIVDFSSYRKHLVLMVLDGRGPKGELDARSAPFFRLVYSGKVSADACIERYLFENRSRAALAVVTDDRAISDMARGGGARVLSGKNFLEILEETERQKADILFEGRVRAHGFNRPFEKKLKDK